MNQAKKPDRGWATLVKFRNLHSICRNVSGRIVARFLHPAHGWARPRGASRAMQGIKADSKRNNLVGSDIHCQFKSQLPHLTIVLALCVLLITACAPKPPRPPPRPAYLNHEIIYRGETLSVIAAWYTGASQNWRDIAAANPEVNPHRLKPGMDIRIPRALVVREDSLPKSFVESAAARVRSAVAEKGSEEATAQDSLPVPQPPRVTPPGAEDEIKSAGATEVPSGAPPQLPDPSTVREGGTLSVDGKPQAAGASSAAVDHDRQKTRDQLLKELLAEY